MDRDLINELQRLKDLLDWFKSGDGPHDSRKNLESFMDELEHFRYRSGLDLGNLSNQLDVIIKKLG